MSSESSKLCVSLLPENFTQLEEWLPQTGAADMREIRIDRIPDVDVSRICALTPLPIIITLRTRAEGGLWDGTAAEYRNILQAAAKAGVAYVDVEFPLAETVLPELEPGNTGVVLSHHSGERSLTALRKIFDKMRSHPADVYKLIFKAKTLNDSATALELMSYAGERGVRFIIHAMGEAGQLSRIIGATRGNAWTYVAKDYQEETASGQPALHEARDFYFLHRKSPGARILGLVGSPIQQSRGWRLHNQLVNRHITEENSNGADFLYLNFPADNFEEFWLDWQEFLYGLSITIPYKEKAVKFLNDLSNEVLISGVCNTIVRSPRGWRGFNTDLLAMEQLLRPHQEIIRNSGLIIGTGATARSAIAALKRLEVNPIFVVGRNRERGKMLSQKYGIDFLEFDEIHYATASVIVQTTPVGMVPYTDQYPPGTSLFRKNRVVLDVVYNPPETRFLKIARERGCVTISGEEMFLLQAAKQFELFTEVPVSVEEMRQVWEEIH